MTVHLKDKSKVSTRWIDGRCKLTFHSINKSLILPIGMEVNIDLIEHLYSAYKGIK